VIGKSRARQFENVFRIERAQEPTTAKTFLINIREVTLPTNGGDHVGSAVGSS
jgi:hypothetical protein